MKGGVAPLAQNFDVIRWRQILGSFQISIPVETKEVLLAPEERLLAVLRSGSAPGHVKQVTERFDDVRGVSGFVER